MVTERLLTAGGIAQPQTRIGSRLVISLLLVAATGCGGDASAPTISVPGDAELLPVLSCQVNGETVFDGGVGRDGIRALLNPTLVPADHPDAQYVATYQRSAEGDRELPDARVVGLVSTACR